MTPDLIQSLFTRPDGSFLCARWGRPIVPVVFGVDDATLSTVKGAIEAIVALSGHNMDETDTELGANLMTFFFRDWAELPEVPHLEKMIPDLGPLCARLAEKGANQYRAFRFDERGAIKAVFSFVRMDAHMSEMPAEDLALVLACEAMLTWGDGALSDRLSPLVNVEGSVVLNPDLARLLVAAYQPSLPVMSQDQGHAWRLFARLPIPTPVDPPSQAAPAASGCCGGGGCGC